MIILYNYYNSTLIQLAHKSSYIVLKLKYVIISKETVKTFAEN